MLVENLTLISLGDARKMLGISKQSIYYKLKHNIDELASHCYVVISGNFNEIKPFKNELLESKITGKRYFFDRNFIEGCPSCETFTDSEQSEFDKLYIQILEIIEDNLEKEKKSIATETQKWLNASIVDSEICGTIFSRYKIDTGEPLPKSDKAIIRRSLYNGYAFSHPRLLRLTITYMREFLFELENNPL